MVSGVRPGKQDQIAVRIEYDKVPRASWLLLQCLVKGDIGRLIIEE